MTKKHQPKALAVTDRGAPGASVVVPIGQPESAAAMGDANLLARLLQFESEIRACTSVEELRFLIANEVRALVPYDQLFVFEQPRIGEEMVCTAASSLPEVDRHSPFIQDLESALASLDTDYSTEKPQAFLLGSLSQAGALAGHPFQEIYWQPLLRANGNRFAGLFLMRSEPLREKERFRINRISETSAHAWRALTSDEPVHRIRRIGRREKIGLAVAGIVIALFPVRMTALAPVEVVPARPYTIAAPISGVIERIAVAPNANVARGEALVFFDDLQLSNELDLAGEKLEVARTRLARAQSSAFSEEDESRDIATLRAELQLAEADYRFAKDVLSRITLSAPVAGKAIYSDRRDWEGRAVNIGDPILQVAASEEVLFKIDLPAKSQMAIGRDAPVEVWLDAQPLWSLDGSVEQASYQARMTPEGVLAFAVTARPNGESPRIGSRGTAKLYGDWVPLIYSILRRPIAAVRQTIGF
ncbi:MAG: HlyD family efflux transporter periplasmic adaptor subunit [Pseudomonadota bacterium]